MSWPEIAAATIDSQTEPDCEWCSKPIDTVPVLLGSAVVHEECIPLMLKACGDR